MNERDYLGTRRAVKIAEIEVIGDPARLGGARLHDRGLRQAEGTIVPRPRTQLRVSSPSSTTFAASTNMARARSAG